MMEHILIKNKVLRLLTEARIEIDTSIAELQKKRKKRREALKFSVRLSDLFEMTGSPIVSAT